MSQACKQIEFATPLRQPRIDIRMAGLVSSYAEVFLLEADIHSEQIQETKMNYGDGNGNTRRFSPSAASPAGVCQKKSRLIDELVSRDVDRVFRTPRHRVDGEWLLCTMLVTCPYCREGQTVENAEKKNPEPGSQAPEQEDVSSGTPQAELDALHDSEGRPLERVTYDSALSPVVNACPVCKTKMRWRFSYWKCPYCKKQWLPESDGTLRQRNVGR